MPERVHYPGTSARICKIQAGAVFNEHPLVGVQTMRDKGCDDTPGRNRSKHFIGASYGIDPMAERGSRLLPCV